MVLIKSVLCEYLFVGKGKMGSIKGRADEMVWGLDSLKSMGGVGCVCPPLGWYFLLTTLSIRGYQLYRTVVHIRWKQKESISEFD